MRLRRSKLPVLSSVLALAVLLFALQISVLAQEPVSPSSQQPQTQADPAAPPSEMSQAGETQVFTGKITKAGGKYVLKDNATKMTYSLDDQSQAKKFEGQSVKVTGMLDPQSNIIHISVIEPGS